MSEKSGGILDMLKTVVYAVLIAVGVRTVAYEPFNIPSGSMLPTLLIGDYLFVSKLSYGYSRYSLPLDLPLFPGRILFEEPERGDVIVFKHPTADKTYIKRLIGLPGDKIQVKGGILHINDVPVKRRKIEDYAHHTENGGVIVFQQYIETLPNGVEHRILEQSDTGFLDNTGVYDVPPGHYFMMGDNRDRSLDSRSLSSVGYVPFENFVGKAQWRFFSIQDNIPPWQIWRWPGNVRFDRMFTSVYQ
ncbi:MAG TPA: signal peptidase I [Pelagibacterium sp.]|nr:signal peptidase I [Pelagibacterium sp.]